MAKFQVLLIGVHYAGKTELARRLVAPDTVFTSTYTASTETTQVLGQEGSDRTLVIIDTPGCAQDNADLSVYQDSKHAPHVVALCVDITNQNSYDLARLWLPQLKAPESRSATAVILVASMWDQVGCPNQAANADDLGMLAAEYGLGNFFPISAKTGEGIALLRERLQSYVLCKDMAAHPYYGFVSVNLEKLQVLIQCKLDKKTGKTQHDVFQKANADIDTEIEGLNSLKTALERYRDNRNYSDDLATDLDNLVKGIQQQHAPSFAKHGGYGLINWLRPESKAGIFCAELINDAKKLRASRCCVM